MGDLEELSKIELISRLGFCRTALEELYDQKREMMAKQNELLRVCKRALKRLRLSNDSESDQMTINSVVWAIKKVDPLWVEDD